MLRLPGGLVSSVPSMTLAARTLATQSRPKKGGGNSTNVKVTWVTLGLLGATCLSSVYTNLPPKEYRGPNGKDFEDNDD